MMGFILSIIALFLFIVVYICFFIFNCIYDVKNKKWFTLTSTRNKSLAKDIDIVGNFLFGDLFNALFSKGCYPFGIIGETISSVLGKKLKEKSLSLEGYILAYIINVVDITTWFKGGHCFDAIQTVEEIKLFINKYQNRKNDITF